MSSQKMWNCMISGFFSGVTVSFFGMGSSLVLTPTLIGFDV
jgi:uncharacterized membrane protein YfcA